MKLSNIFAVIIVTFVSGYLVMTTYERSFSSRLPLKQKIDEIGVSGYEAIENLFDASVGVAKRYTDPDQESLSKEKNTIPVEKVTNVGYTFYLGQIDYPNSPPISDAVKTQLTKSIAATHFPQRLLDRMSIIIVNSLASSPTMRIENPKGVININDFTPEFLHIGGSYTNYINAKTLIILKKEDTTNLSRLNEIFTHELGHDISNELTTEEWQEFYRLRNIPADTPRYGTGNWNMTPNEDFAEVYMHIFAGGTIKTKYGLLESSWGMDIGPCQETYFDVQLSLEKESVKNLSQQDILNSLMSLKVSEQDILVNSTLQKCRREHSDSYVGTVDEKVKNFVQKVVSRIH